MVDQEAKPPQLSLISNVDKNGSVLSARRVPFIAIWQNSWAPGAMLRAAFGLGSIMSNDAVNAVRGNFEFIGDILDLVA